MFWNKICGFIAIFFLAALFSSGQITSYTKYPVTKALISPFNLSAKASDKTGADLLRPFVIIPQNYYARHFGIMCKKELAFEKTTKVPFRFRLGSLQQCNYLEGKK